MQTRKPFVAGQFYPAQHDECIKQINAFLNKIEIEKELPEKIDAAIAPHAGWVFSGSLAALAFYAIKQQEQKVNTFIIFGASHGYYGPVPTVYNTGSWQSPLGEIVVDEELAAEISDTGFAVNSCEPHIREHSIEVQIPFIQNLFSGAKIVPIIVPASGDSISLGQAVADIILQKKDKNYVCIGSTDLTHYGPHYGFTPMGKGSEAIEWATNINDTDFIDLALKLETKSMLKNAIEKHNACGPGAAAATIAAAKKLGKSSGVLLAHTNSNIISKENLGSTSDDSVGYAALVF